MSAPIAGGISIVVPTLDEEHAITETLRALREPGVAEVIVVDGGSRDRTAALARPLADRVVTSARGRGRQLNAGARLAKGGVLLFVHADSRPPAGFASAILAAVGRGAVGGRFDVELDGRGVGYRIVEAAINLRSRWTRLATGDQGQFVRRDVFEQLGGFPEVPLFEDLALALAMKRAGEVACLRARVRTSARRWRRGGLVRTVARMWLLRSLWALGVAPERLARFYDDVR